MEHVSFVSLIPISGCLHRHSSSSVVLSLMEHLRISVLLGSFYRGSFPCWTSVDVISSGGFFRGAHFLGKHWCGFFPQGNWLLDVLSFFGGHSLRSTLWGPLFRVTLHAPLGGCGFSFLRTSIEVHPPLGYGGCLFFPVNTCCSFFTRTFVKFQVHGNVGGCPFFRWTSFEFLSLWVHRLMFIGHVISCCFCSMGTFFQRVSVLEFPGGFLQGTGWQW